MTSATFPATLSDRERLDWLRLIRTPRVGPATFHGLLQRFGTAEQALDALPDLLRSARTTVRIPSPSDVERELATAAAFGALIVAHMEPDYPQFLRKVDCPPPLISVWGDAAIFAKPPVAIVGARNASAAGTRMARLLAAELGSGGLSVVSGLARGIDAAAHTGALQTGTVAVLAGGIDRPYPNENIPLYRRIANEGGAVISEMPWGWEPRAQDFPRRNRIIAGMSLGLVVVEAAMRSGSLISARLAGEMGRLVFAVPGSPLDPRAAGANRLLKDGATIVTEASDVIEGLTPLLGGRDIIQPVSAFAETSEAPAASPMTDTDRSRVVEALGPTPVSTDEIAAHTGLGLSEIMLVLLELDLAGRLERHSGGAVSLVALDM